MLLFGGERVSFYLARILEKKKINVKIIERDPEKCEELAKKSGQCINNQW
jgi:Trk K+ transport system NAD-binding subunit